MDDRNAWIEGRLSQALKAATTEAHSFPAAVAEELRALLVGGLQESRKPAELDEIAASLIAANRSET